MKRFLFGAVAAVAMTSAATTAVRPQPATLSLKDWTDPVIAACFKAGQALEPSVRCMKGKPGIAWRQGARERPLTGREAEDWCRGQSARHIYVHACVGSPGYVVPKNRK